MRYKFHYPGDGRQFHCDSELTFTHIVVGQRNEAADEAKLPSDRLKRTVDKWTPDELAAINKFVFDSTRGWYGIKPIAWAGSEAEAVAIKTRFEGEGWINVGVFTLGPQNIITHA